MKKILGYLIYWFMYATPTWMQVAHIPGRPINHVYERAWWTALWRVALWTQREQIGSVREQRGRFRRLSRSL